MLTRQPMILRAYDIDGKSVPGAASEAQGVGRQVWADFSARTIRDRM